MFSSGDSVSWYYLEGVCLRVCVRVCRKINKMWHWRCVCSVDHHISGCEYFAWFVMPPTVEKGAISVAFFRPSVCPSVAYLANNSRTQRPSLPRFGMKVPHLRCDLHTSFKIKRSKVRLTDGRGHTVSAEPGGHTACLFRWVSKISLARRQRCNCGVATGVMLSQIFSCLFDVIDFSDLVIYAMCIPSSV